MRPFIPRTSLKVPTLLYFRTEILFSQGGKTENGGYMAPRQLSGHAHSTPIGPMRRVCRTVNARRLPRTPIDYRSRNNFAMQ